MGIRIDGNTITLTTEFLTDPGVASIAIPTLAPLAKYVKVTAVGAGGGSNTASASEFTGQGGGGGAARRLFTISSLPNPTILYIGNGSAGEDGGSTIFNIDEYDSGDPESSTLAAGGFSVTGGSEGGASAAAAAVSAGGLGGGILDVDDGNDNPIELFNGQLGASYAGGSHAMTGLPGFDGTSGGHPGLLIITPAGVSYGQGAVGKDDGGSAGAGVAGAILLEFF